MRWNQLLLIIWIFALLSCATSRKATTYDFPKPVDTTDKAIDVQVKKTYSFPNSGLSADNLFDGARLNNFSQINDSLFQATISPENSPINASAWYAFRIKGQNQNSVYVKLHYTKAKHRYHPKISIDGMNWTKLDSTLVMYDQDSVDVTLKLNVTEKPLWVSAQELVTSSHVKAWCNDLESKNTSVTQYIIGKSKGGRDLHMLDITSGNSKKKPVIVLLSRQHPPEVTGFKAMQAFVDEIISGEQANSFLEKYRVLVFPLLNPDGVDMGHWRHNMGGIDLNRDWAYYHQPETRQVANHIVATTKKHKNKVLLGLDFHSTWYDVFYTLPSEEFTTNIPGFKDDWLAATESAIGNGYEVNEKPSGLGSPVTKGWFFTQFNAEGVTYEIGDSTPRDFIQQKGQLSAREMIRILLKDE